MAFPLLRRTLGVLACVTACIPTLALACAPLIPCEIPLDHAQLFEEYIDTESFRKAHPSFPNWIRQRFNYTPTDCIRKGEQRGTSWYMFILPVTLSRFGLEYPFSLPLTIDRDGTVMIGIPNPEELIRETEAHWEVEEFMERATLTDSELVQTSIDVNYDYSAPRITYHSRSVGRLTYNTATKLFDFQGYQDNTTLKQRSAFCRYSLWICRLFP